jgi:hypothetical protein
VPDQSKTDQPSQGAAKPSKRELREYLDRESTRRGRVATPVFAGGVLYLLGSITMSATLKGLPSVGLIQGVAPALNGQPNPAVSPRAAEVRFYDHHAFGLIAGSVLSGLAILMLLAGLRFLTGAARFRRPQTNPVFGVLTLIGGIGVPLFSVIGECVQAVASHNFTTGHEFTTHAVEHALTKNAAYEILGYITPLAAIALVVGMIATMFATVRVGLQPRWMGIVGGVGALILLVPSQELSLIPAFWMVGAGILLMGRFPGGDPPAWASGEARPWPSKLDSRVAGAAQSNARQGKQKESGSTDVAPAPVPSAATDGRRRRKRGAGR